MSQDREKEGVQRKTLAEMPMKKAKEEVTRKERGWEGSKVHYFLNFSSCANLT